MATEETAQQLELAAQIIRTGHPWGYRQDKRLITSYKSPLEVIQDGHVLIPLLATPPDNRPLHNPDSLTAEQVGVGWRLTLKGEPTNLQIDQQEFWSGMEWQKSGTVYTPTFDADQNSHCTYRLPLSIPWPSPKPDPYAELKKAHAEGKVIECITGTDRRWMAMQGEPRWFLPVEDYRIKPESPPFQLPLPPPSIQWHRTDGWQKGDLPQGWRPLVEDEYPMEKDECIAKPLESEWRASNNWRDGSRTAEACHYRTRRPLTFTHAGKTWTWHRPGSKMPCDVDALIWVLYADGTTSLNSYCANEYVWDRVIGWRYADEKKTVPLGPEDVKPFTVIRRKGEAQTWHWRTVSYVDAVKVTCGNRGYGWAELASDYERNESLTTGKWNPDAWEPCHKLLNKMGKP